MIPVDPFGTVMRTSGEHVPPDPTQYVLVWGDRYPCLKQDAVGQVSSQCGGMMTPDLVSTFEGREWQHFTCNRCGRQADDYKVNDDE